MQELIADLQELHRGVSDPEVDRFPEKIKTKHLARNKLLPRDRIAALIDPGTAFMEFSMLAGHDMYGKDKVPAGGIISGIGVVNGVKCVIIANDSTVKGGTYFPITVRKHLRAQEIAIKTNCPVSTWLILAVLIFHTKPMFSLHTITLAASSFSSQSCHQRACRSSR